MAGAGGAPSTAAVCLPNHTTLQVSASNASAYVIGGLPAEFSDGIGDKNAPLKLCRGYSYTLTIAAVGHPFYFKTAATTGVTDAYNSGVTNNGTAAGAILFTVPADAPAALFYHCSIHQPMGASVSIVNPS